VNVEATLDATVDRFLDIWGQPGDAALHELRALCHPDVVYHNPVIALTGVEALAAHVGELAALIGTRRLSRTTGLQSSGSWCRYGWALLPQVPGADLSGHTVIEIDAGRFAQIVSFHGDPPPRTFTLPPRVVRFGT